MAFVRSNFDWKSEPQVREKMMIGIVALLLIVPFIRGLWSPVEDAINKTQTDNKIVQSQVDKVKDMIKATDKQNQMVQQNLSENIKAQSRAMRILSRQSLDSNTEVSSAIAELSSRDRIRNLELGTISVGNEVPFPNYTVIPVNITLFGKYAAIERYLKSLEETLYPFMVRGINLSRIQGSSHDLGAQLTVWVYFAGRQKAIK